MAEIAGGGGGSSRPPKAKLSLPKPSVSTGSNPRGTAIRLPTPKPTINDKQAVTLGTGANPRGTAIRQPRPTVKTPAAPKTVRRGQQLDLTPAAINPTGSIKRLEGMHFSLPSGAINIPHFLVHIAGNTGKDLINLPGSTLQGLEAVGSAAGHDALHFFTHPLDARHSQLVDLGGKIIKGDPFVQAIEHGSLKPLTDHPLFAGLDLAGAEGLVGREAGSVGRSGVLGEDAAKAASTAREGRILAPGLPADVRHWSPDLIRKAFQFKFDRTPSPRLVKKLLQKRVDEFVPTAKAAKQASLKEAETGLKEAMPQGAAAHVTSHAVMGTAGNPSEFVSQLRDRILPALKDEHASGTLIPAARKANEQHQANIEAFLAHPDTPAAFAGAGHFHDLRAAIEPELGRLGLRTTAEMERRALEPLAQTQMPGVEMVPKTSKMKLPDGRTVTRQAGIPTVRSHQAREVLRQIGSETKLLRDAEKHQIKMGNFHGDAERAVRKGERSLARADRAETKQAAFIQGRYGLNDELKTARARASADALDKRLVTTDAVTSHLQDLKGALKEARAARKTEAKEQVAAVKENVKTLKQEFAQVHKPYVNEKAHGLMIEDPAAPMVRAGKYKGRHLRPLSNDEIRSYMEQHSIPYADYIKLTAPTDESVVGRGRLTRGGSKGKSYTGAGLDAGAFTPGYGALARTHLGSVAQVQDALAHDRFIRESGITPPAGEDWRHFAEQYHQEHGIQLEALYRHPQAITKEQRERIRKLQDPELGHAQATLESREVPEDAEASPDRIVLVPKVMMDRYRQHLNMTPGNSWVSGANRVFRNTVLPFSTKWLTGNAAEAGLRGALVGASPKSFALAGRVISRMRELGLNDQADHLERMATGGLHYGMQERLNAEHVAQTGSAVTEHSAATTLKTVSRGYTGVIQKIYAWNRHMESGAEKAVLGRHMQRQLSEFSTSWAKTVTAQKDYIDRLAEGYADPRMAADAGRYVHDVLGQYDRFSPGIKKFISTWAPFFPWYRNALKFVYYSLPAKHPVAQAALLGAARANATAFNKGRDVPHGTFFGQPVGDLLEAPKVGPSDYLNLGRYSPEGAFTQGPVDYALNGVAPQLQGIWHALNGQDPFGNDLTGPAGKLTDTGQRALVALNDLVTEFAGPVNVLNRVIREHGSTPYNTSTLWNTQLKPNTHHSPGLVKVFNPLEPTHLGKTAIKVKGGAKVQGGTGTKVQSGTGAKVQGGRPAKVQ